MGSHERRSPDKLVAQGLIQVRGPGGDLVGDKKGRILLHFNCAVKGLADYVLFRCQYEWRTSTRGIDQPELLDFGMPSDLSYEIRQQLRIKHRVFEAIDFDKGKAFLSAASRHILDQVAKAI